MAPLTASAAPRAYRPVRPTRDVMSVTRFRAELSGALVRLHHSRAPLVLTRHGYPLAVVQSSRDYEERTDEIESLRQLNEAVLAVARERDQTIRGVAAQLRGMVHRDVFRMVESFGDPGEGLEDGAA